MIEKSCWLCDLPMTNSREHIIPKSIGGLATVRGFICKSCNDETGRKWDVAVPKFLDFLLGLNPDTRFLLKDRHPSSLPRGITPDSQKIELSATGPRVKYGIRKVGDELRFTFSPAEKDRAYEKMVEIQKRMGATPMTRNEFEATIVEKQKVKAADIPQSVKCSIELSAPLFRSVTKTALAMAFHAGISPFQCPNVVEYLRGDAVWPVGVAGLFPFPFRGDWANYHSVTVLACRGSDRRAELWGEVMYCGITLAIVRLSDRYYGPNIVQGYTVNLKTGVDEFTDLFKGSVIPSMRSPLVEAATS